MVSYLTDSGTSYKSEKSDSVGLTKKALFVEVAAVLWAL